MNKLVSAYQRFLENNPNIKMIDRRTSSMIDTEIANIIATSQKESYKKQLASKYLMSKL